jgi:hypothetical protein
MCRTFCAIKYFPLIVTGMCVKTHTEAGDKVFINVCHTPELPAPDDISEDALMKIWTSEEHSSFRIPMSIGEGRAVVDKGSLHMYGT